MNSKEFQEQIQLCDPIKDKTQLRLTLLQGGYAPIKIIGKAPHFGRWQDIEITEELIKSKEWDRDGRALNTGLRCGKLVGLDLDFDGGYLLEKFIERIENHATRFYPSSVIRIGNAPRELWVYRCAQEVRSRRSNSYATAAEYTSYRIAKAAAGDDYHAQLKALEQNYYHSYAIDIIGHGKQFAAFGIHPNTDQPFDWPDQPLPAFEDLPEITEDQIAWLLKEFEDFMEEETAKGVVLQTAKGVSTGRFEHVRKLTRDTMLYTMDHGDMSVGELLDKFAVGFEDRCSVHGVRSESVRRENGQVRILPGNQVALTDYVSAQVYLIDLSDEMQRTTSALAERLLKREGVAQRVHEEAAKSKAAQDAREASKEWKDKLRYKLVGPKDDKVMQYYKDTENIVRALRLAPELVGLIGYDNFAQHPVRLREGPGGEPLAKPEFWSDGDTMKVCAWLQAYGDMPDVQTMRVKEALLLAREDYRFDPLADYLEGLSWDGVSRLDTWLNFYCDVDDNPLNREIARRFLISAVARGLEPGCKVDTVLLMYGEQGAGKSTAAEVLAGDWFSDDLPSLNNERAAEFLQGNWIVEMPEMKSIMHANDQEIKAFLARRKDDLQRKYEANVVKSWRRNVFLLTTNREDMLTDVSGNRRYWPVTVGAIDTEGLGSVRDQLFAEAVEAYAAGEQWWLLDEFDDQLAERHIKHAMQYAFDDNLEAMLRSVGEEGVSMRKLMMRQDVGGLGLKMNVHADIKALTAALKRWNWEKKKTSKGNLWLRGDNSHPKYFGDNVTPLHPRDD